MKAEDRQRVFIVDDYGARHWVSTTSKENAILIVVRFFDLDFDQYVSDNDPVIKELDENSIVDVLIDYNKFSLTAKEWSDICPDSLFSTTEY